MFATAFCVALFGAYLAGMASGIIATVRPRVQLLVRRRR
jgi:hypothetical protein